MSVASTSPRLASGSELIQMPFLRQVITLTLRYIRNVFRTPAEFVPSIMISVFFLFVYDASLSGAATFFLPGQSYLGFILPVAVVSAALGGAGVAGQAIVSDITSGYFDKLLLTPVNRAALLLGSIFAGAFVLGLQSSAVIIVAVLIGLAPETGVLGLLAVLGIALLLGTAFAGFTVGVGLRTGNPGATQGASFLFFPLTFLTATFVPTALLTGWIKTAAAYNPVTYILEAMRSILNQGWQPDVIVRGILACAAMGVITFAFSMAGLRARTRRK